MTLVDGPFLYHFRLSGLDRRILLMLFTGLVFPLLSKMMVALSR